MKLSPALTGLRTYPFVRLDEAKRRLQADGVDFIDFGVGEPREETPAFIREALIAALEPLSTYPQAVGLPDLRAAISEWTARRFGAQLDPDTQVLPTLGSKEAIFHMAQVLGGDLVAVPAPAYPVYERGAVFAGTPADTASWAAPAPGGLTHGCARGRHLSPLAAGRTNTRAPTSYSSSDGSCTSRMRPPSWRRR